MNEKEYLEKAKRTLSTNDDLIAKNPNKDKKNQDFQKMKW